MKNSKQDTHSKIVEEITKHPMTKSHLNMFIDGGSALMQHLTKKGYTSKEVYDFLKNVMLNDI